MLCPEYSWLIKINVYISISARDFIIRPSSMSVMLRPNKEWYSETKSSDTVFKSTCVPVLNKIPNKFVKTLMADNLNIDLKDNDGGFNCGKPAGYIKDFKALPEKTQELIKQIKRVRAVFGTVEMTDVVDEQGNKTTIESTPFIWEIDNRDAFKLVGDSFNKLAKMKRLPVQHAITANTEERKLPNGSSYYVPVVSLNVTETLELTDAEQDMFSDFMSWVDNYNTYIANAWGEKANAHMDEDDVDVVDGLVDIDIEDEVA